MVQFTRLFVSLCLIAASFAAPTKRTVAQVEADIASISKQVTALDNDIKGYPASGLFGALDLHSTAGSLAHTLKTGTSDVKAIGPVDEADATTILDEVQALKPVIIDALTRIVDEKADFATLLVPVVLQDLQALKTNTDAFGDALISVAPGDLGAQATSILSDIDAAFATAIAAYS